MRALSWEQSRELTRKEGGGRARPSSSMSWIKKSPSPSGVWQLDYDRSQVAAIRDISRSCLDLNDFTVLSCIVKGHSSFDNVPFVLSSPSLRLRLCSRFTLLAT
ncbi:hypothetical protein TNCV_2152591 [Trichonephila clavipes]|nr:hypothetical protein TNCV_2152591 [Trichonephila clavipes]